MDGYKQQQNNNNNKSKGMWVLRVKNMGRDRVEDRIEEYGFIEKDGGVQGWSY